MPASLPVGRIHDFFCYSLVKVLSTMSGIECALRRREIHHGAQIYSPRIDPGRDPSTRIFAASVGFFGMANGVCQLFMGDRFAYRAAHRVTGISYEYLNDRIVCDACGELGNMFAGTFKNSLADLGFPSTLSLPVVVQGKRLRIRVAEGSERHRFAFDADGLPIFADLVLRGVAERCRQTGEMR